ncbi:AAA domain-containing protein [Pseudovibrio sp. Ad37]|uniref:AAA domain-containing protein n=1 Tax=Pseudovibrio sp. Ad37 TaxID=989422 RepID=UPI0007AE9E94|nr:AAA domain-containing protein [Pseudovibrio sp. Ad37]KZL15109.1 ATP-dependent RecD-like DNA helicase [Pseudovibrio sp. Ad37]
MSARPFFNKSISDLEDTFANNRGDADILNLLLDELEHRKTGRALSLKENVLQAQDGAATLQQNDSLIETPTINKHSNQAWEVADVVEQANQGKSFTARKQSPSVSEVAEDPQNILSAWTALEVLSPQGYRREEDLVGGDKSRIARFDKRELPWVAGEKSRPNKRLYYELFLGAVELAPGVEALLKCYADKRPDKPSMRGQNAIATVLLDKDGRPVDEENSIGVSSFAWGMPIALSGDLEKLAAWPVAEKQIIAFLRKRLLQRDDEGELIPLSKQSINDVFDELTSRLGLVGHKIKEPSFAIRTYEFYGSKTPPESTLLNSFFLGDLAKARNLASAGQLPHALKHYLKAEHVDDRKDLLEDTDALQELLQPALTPTGRWASRGRFPLALLQQAAVNASSKQQLMTGILGVNGPPGTGKTTLLRDVVAARIIERAEVMCSFSDPESAFKPTNVKLQRNGAKVSLHELDARLKGFEMVVASSNNKAVENVSAELPSLNAVADDAPELRYFKTISDSILETETWGVISAVLGNKSNRYNFSQRFWRDPETGLSTYLNHASGVPQIINEEQEDGSVRRRYRKIINLEQAPNNSREAKARWGQARSRFKEAFDTFRQLQDELQKVHVQVSQLEKATRWLEENTPKISRIKSDFEELGKRYTEIDARREKARELVMASDEEKQDLYERRPSFFARLFRTQSFRDWAPHFDKACSWLEDCERELAAIKKEAERYFDVLTEKKLRLEDAEKKLEEVRAAELRLKQTVKAARERCAAIVPDEQFFSTPHEQLQTSSVWFDKLGSRMRDEIFEAAVSVHRTFIDCCADRLKQNLAIFIQNFGTRSLGSPAKDALLPDLWASFFLVVPVVSTTFASIDRMFTRLGTESLGWLLIDEAGQAVPQAAVGALMRSQQAVVVGDPLQIEPVVTLPNSLTEEICAYFAIDPLKFNAPEASVQTLADTASVYGARFPSGSGYRDVGAPLLVHRRCSSPMFEISNEIAYSNLMVQAKAGKPSETVLGRSSWIDVRGTATQDKWCVEEAKVLIEMLSKLRASGRSADIYVVTPFVIVQDNLRREILNSGVLQDWVEKPNSWVYEHVGTVHTVQGREAEIVFFVLGAQAQSQNGARAWAGGKPNLVNVAVTRAKGFLYVIGNRSLWKNAGVFATLDRHLP